MKRDMRKEKKEELCALIRNTKEVKKPANFLHD